MIEQLALAMVIAGSSVAAAVAAVLGLHAVTQRRQRRDAVLAATRASPEEDAVLLFDDERLVEASEAGHAFLRALPPGPSPWARLAGWARLRFPGFEARIAALAQEGEVRLTAPGPLALRLTASWDGRMARIALHDPAAEGRTVQVDRISLAAAEAELLELRQTLDSAPLPIWRETAAGEVTWANPAYLHLAAGAGTGPGGFSWPLPAVFAAAQDPRKPQRRGLATPSPDGPRWFDCRSIPAGDGQTLCFALPADAAAQAEVALKDLVQTLSRTFAHLPVGLAVFDRQRRLQIFNPALGDLTTLPVEFLSARPGFEAFFDALRSRQMIPEPKDYRAWRRNLTEIERAAASGHYQEIWSLTTGQTYRVTGRPQPDGAVALLIEDVSAEVSLTRRFRAEIETGQAVIDSLPEAIAVFSSAGVLVMTNAAYARLWGSDPETTLGEIGVAEALRSWKALAHPSPHWGQLRTLVSAGGGRRSWEGAIQLRDGRHMLCRLVPLTGGASMVSFSQITGKGAPVPLGLEPARPASDAPLPEPLPPSAARPSRPPLTAAEPVRPVAAGKSG